MNPSYHFFLGILFSAFLFFLFPELGLIPLFLIFASSILIDVDHYLFYIYEKRGFNLRKAYNYFLEHKRKWREFGKDVHNPPSSFFIFHGLEVLLLLFALSFFFKPLYFIFIGFSFHLLLDLVEQALYSNKFQKVSTLNDFLNYKQ